MPMFFIPQRCSRTKYMQNFYEIDYKFATNDSYANQEQVDGLLDNYSTTHSPSRKDLLDDIKANFPVYTDQTGKVRILGSERALKIMNQITDHKTDKQLSLKDLTQIDFKLIPPSTNYEMYFVEDGQNAQTSYNAKDTFLDNYSLAKHANYLLQNNKKQNLLNDLNDLQQTVNLSDKQATYRFIDINRTHYLRAIVSNRYKFYDNQIALYMAISIISKYSVEHKQDFILKSMTVTDSKLYAYFLEKSPIKLNKNLTIQTGLVLSNSELGDGSASFKVCYTIQDNNNNRVVGLTDQIANINHGNNPLSIEKDFKNLQLFEEQRRDIIQAVRKVQWTKKLTRDDLDTISYLISHMQAPLPKQLKAKMAKCIDPNKLLGKSYTLMMLFNKFNSFIQNEDPNIQLIMEARISRWLSRFVK